jgi:hypothetical protein
VRDAARVHDGDVRFPDALDVAIRDEPLADLLGVGLGDLAAQELGREGRHRGAMLTTAAS